MRRQLPISTAALLVFVSLPGLAWCDEGYGWVYRPHVTTFLDFAVVFLIVPWMVVRALARLGGIKAIFGTEPKEIPAGRRTPDGADAPASPARAARV